MADGPSRNVRLGRRWRAVRDPWGLTELRDRDIRRIIDADAGIGAFSAFVRTLWPRAAVLACEAYPHRRRLLRLNVGSLSEMEIIPEDEQSESCPCTATPTCDADRSVTVLRHALDRRQTADVLHVGGHVLAERKA